MTDDEKKQLVVAVITQLKNDGIDVSNAKIEEDVNGISYVICYNVDGEIVRASTATLHSGILGEIEDIDLDTIRELADKVIENQDKITTEITRAKEAEKNIDDKLNEEIERSVAADQDLLSSIDEEARRATEAEEAIKNKAVEADSLNFQTRANVVALDYKTIEGVGDEITIPAATAEKAGVMSAEDKKALDTATSRALRALFVAAGAAYNDTGADKTKTAPWGETVTHKAGHYYLNGLGDITEEQMMRIYNRGHFNDSDKAPLGYSNGRVNRVRTNLCRIGMWNASLPTYICVSNTMIETVNLHIINDNARDTCMLTFSDTESLFNGASKLAVIDTRCLLNSSLWKSTTFKGCLFLKEVRINFLRSDISFADSYLLSKASVLFMIEKAAPTAAITITLHPDAYARLNPDLAENADIKSALEAQPLITLASA